MKNKIIYLMICMLVFSNISGIISSTKTSTKSIEELAVSMDYSHTILGEYGTATWCGYCRYAHGALKNIYAGKWHPFYYISFVTDKNENAYDRVKEYNVYGYPTVWFDGGYRVNVGASSEPSAQAAYNSSIVACGNRGVNDIDLFLNVTWLGPNNPRPKDGATDEAIDVCLNWTDSTMNISVLIDNNEESTYGGTLRVYVNEVESSMGWYDTGNKIYTFPFLDYAFNEEISISAGKTWEDAIVWDGKDHNTGYEEDFGNITQDNIMVIAAVFDDEWHQGYSYPPSSNPFDAYYVDETEGCLAGSNTDPKTYDIYFGNTTPPPKVSSNQSNITYDPGRLKFDTKYYWKIVAWDNHSSSIVGQIYSFTTRGNQPPNEPSDPDPEDSATDIEIDTVLHWTSEDPDGDEVTYDVYFGDSSPPPLVKNNKTKPIYDPPGELDFDTTYYWKVVSWDEFNYSSSGSVWSFTTEENIAPNEPSDPDPSNGTTDVNIETDLSWTGGDPNSGDEVTYDVYFGKTNPPPKVIDNQSDTNYDPDTMDLNTIYHWKIIAWDSQNLSTSGDIWHFTTELVPNEAPSKPDIDGAIKGKAGTAYDYDFSATDPNEDDVKYIIDWGDGNNESTDLNPSGNTVTLSHSWAEKGDYVISVKAEDEHGLAGSEATLEVSMPKNKMFNIDVLFQRFLENHPRMFPILRHLLGIF